MILNFDNFQKANQSGSKLNNSRIKKKIIPEKIIREIVEFFKDS